MLIIKFCEKLVDIDVDKLKVFSSLFGPYSFQVESERFGGSLVLLVLAFILLKYIT
jgi:hypothetical protein